MSWVPLIKNLNGWRNDQGACCPPFAVTCSNGFGRRSTRICPGTGLSLAVAPAFTASGHLLSSDALLLAHAQEL